MATSSLFSKRLAIGVVVAIGASAIATGTVFGWTNPGPYGMGGTTAPINFWNNCGPGDKDVMAADGDVITTQKWNQTMCLFMQSFLWISDWPRGKTPFLWNSLGGGGGGPATNEINGVKGMYVETLLVAGPGGGGAMNFYDSNSQFPTQADGRSNVLASVQYHPYGIYGGGSISQEGLHLHASKGAVYINTCFGTSVNPHCDDTVNGSRAVVGNSYGQYPLGWIEVNLYDTAPFDPSCMYRFHTTNNFGTMRYPIWVWSDEISSSRPYASQGGGVKISFGYVTAANKTAYRIEDVDLSGNKTITNLVVEKMEKLCLPTYTPFGPNQNMQ